MPRDDDDVFDLSKLEGTLPPDVIESLNKAFGVGGVSGKNSYEEHEVPQLDGSQHPLECCHYHAFKWLAGKLDAGESLTVGEQATAAKVLRKVAKDIRDSSDGVELSIDDGVTVISMDDAPPFLQNLIGVLEKAAEAREKRKEETVLEKPGVAITKRGCEVRDTEGRVVKLDAEQTLQAAATIVAWVSTQPGLLQDTLRDYTRKEKAKLEELRRKRDEG